MSNTNSPPFSDVGKRTFLAYGQDSARLKAGHFLKFPTRQESA